MHRFVWLLLTCLISTHVAHAAPAKGDPFEVAWKQASTPPPSEPTLFERLDAGFGAVVVGPLATVMFFDVLFWDDNLPAGQGVGRWEVPAKVDAAAPHVVKVTAYEPDRGYARQRVIRAEGPLVPVLSAPGSATVDGLQVNLQTEMQGGRPVLMARVPQQAVDVEAFGLAPWSPGTDAPAEVVITPPGLGFPVTIDRRTWQAEPASGVAPDGLVPVEPGATVWHEASGAEWIVLSRDGAAWRLMEPETTYSDAPLPNPEQASMPIVVAWLVLGACFFTLRMGLINLRAFPHALAVVTGRYDGEHDGEHGEISHFQALSSALSATVGLGNIAGVAIAISLGGPGAVFWLWVAGFLGMSSKFTECTLGQMYRQRAPDGTISGGPMHYLDAGLAELGLAPLGKLLAILFAVMCVGGSLGGGNMFQANQSFEAIAEVVPAVAPYAWVYGLVLMVVVGFVIIGGIRRIGAAAGVIVPVMCGVYVLAGVWVLAANAADVPAAFGSIVHDAFTPAAGYGGMMGVLAMGFQRASFSSEAGVGSASIAHSAASTEEPVREGVVALLEPFIDTLVVCTITALVVVVTKADVPAGSGISATMAAFATIIPWFPYVLAFAAMMFAFSTMVSWSYYGERSAIWLFGEVARTPYRVLFLCCVFLGSVIKLGNVLDFSDLMILGMAFPNILGAALLSGKVKRALDIYLDKLRSGAFQEAA